MGSPFQSMWGQGGPFPSGGPATDQQPRAFPSPPNFHDYLYNTFGQEGVNNLPDNAYQAMQEKFFNEHVLPWGAQTGQALQPLQDSFMQQTARDKAPFPRTELMAKQALASALAPAKAFGGDLARPAGEAQVAADRAALEAAKQGISPGPYQLLGDLAGQSPYWAAGMGAAGAGMEAAGVGEGLLKKAITTAAGGLIQGTYDAAKAPEGSRWQEGMRGAAIGGAFVGGIEAIGPMWKFLRGYGLSDAEAKAVEAVARNLATPEQEELAGQATMNTPHLEMDLRDWVSQQIQGAKAAGVPKDVFSEVPNGRLKVKLNLADGTQYNLGGAVGAKLGDFAKIIDRLSGHLGQGASIETIGGDPEVINKFMNGLERINSGSFKLDVPEGGANSDTNSPTRTEANDTIGPPWSQPEWEGTSTEVRKAKSLDEIINARNSYFHATDLEGMRGILEAGKIEPTPSEKATPLLLHALDVLDPSIGDNASKIAEMQDMLSTAGVSVSRVPRLASKAEKAITFVIDADKMPGTRSYVESGYAKTTEPTGTFGKYAQGPPPDEAGYQEWLKNRIAEGTVTPVRNPQFEFEQRTYNKPIPLSAVRGIVVDKEALAQYRGANLASLREGFPEQEARYQELKGRDLQEVQQLADQYKIPIRFVESGAELHGYRAGISRLDPMYSKLLPSDVPASEKIVSPAEQGLRDRVEDLYRAGLGIQDIADKMGVNYHTVLGWIGEVDKPMEMDYPLSKNLTKMELEGQPPMSEQEVGEKAQAFMPEALKSKGLVRGSIDVPLNQAGKERAELVGRGLAGQFDRLISADMTRDQQTMAPFQKYNPSAEVDTPTPAWRSWARGEFEGGDMAPAKKFAEDIIRDPSKWDIRHPGMSPMSTQPGESFNDFISRVIPAFESLKREWNTDRVINAAQGKPAPKYGIFTHFNPIRLVEAYVKEGGNKAMGIDFEHFLGPEPEPGLMINYNPETNALKTFDPLKYDGKGIDPGMMFIRHEETDMNPTPTSKETPLYHRVVSAPDTGMARGLGVEGDFVGATPYSAPGRKPTIVFNPASGEVNKGAFHHEGIHAAANNLDLHDWFSQDDVRPLGRENPDPFIKDIYNNLLKSMGYGKRGSAEETFAYVSQGIRSQNERLLDSLAKADTDRETMMKWYTEKANDLMDRTAQLPDSLHKRTLERRINYTISQASGWLNDVRRPFAQTHNIDYDPDQGLWYTESLQSGQRGYFGTKEQALSYLEQAGMQEPLNSPELVDTSKLPEFPRFARRLEAPNNGKPPIQTDPPSPDLDPGSQVSKGILALSAMVRPFYNWVDTAATKLDRPDLANKFFNVRDAHVDYNNAMRPYEETLKETVGSKEYAKDGWAREQDFGKYIRAKTQDARDEVIRNAQFSAEELSHLNQFEEHFKNLPGFMEYFQDTVPELRAGMPVEARFPPINPAMEGDLLKRGQLDPNDDDLRRVAATYLRGRMFHDILKPVVDAASDVVNEKVGGDYSFGLLRPILNRQLQFYRGVPDYTQRLVMDGIQRLTSLYNQGVDKLNENVLPAWWQMNHIEEGPRDVLQQFILFNYAGALALRPMVPIRDSLQLFLTTFPILGEKYIWQGMRRTWSGAEDSLGRDAWETARNSGWLVERPQLPEMLGGGETKEEGLGAKVEGKVESWVKNAMSVISYAHNSNRIVAGWGHTLKVLDAMEDFAADGDKDKFIRSSDLWFLGDVKRDALLREAGKLTTSPDQWEPFATRAARDLIDATQWNYSKGAAPGIYKYQLGRLFGQYGTWPLNYIEYGRNLVGSLAGPYRKEAAIALTRLGITHGAVLSAMGAMGIDAGHWVFTQPMAYGGGPLFEAVTNIPQSMDFESYKGAEARQKLIEPIWPGLVPGYEETHSLFQAISSNSDDAWIRMLGFSPMKPGEEERGYHRFVP